MSKKSPELHLEILDLARRAVFARLKKFQRYGYLAGGTALALQLGHRYSYDFDIFCAKPISEGLRLNAKKVFGIKQLLVDSADELTFLTKGEIKITFLHYPFVFTEKPIRIELFIPLLPVLSVAVSKAYTLNRRGSWRDYIDLYMILMNGLITLSKIIATAEKVYGSLFNAKLFLGQLVYTKDISPDEVKSVVYLDKPIKRKTIEEFFIAEVKKIANNIS